MRQVVILLWNCRLHYAERLGLMLESLRSDMAMSMTLQIEFQTLVSPAHKAFIASLQSVSIPKDWKAAKLDPRWKERRNEGGAWCTSEEQDVGSSSTPSRKKSSWMQMGVHRKTDSRG